MEQSPQAPATPPKINSIADILRLKARLLADGDSVTDEELKASYEFTRDARTAQTGAKPKSKASKKATPTMQDIFDL